MSLIVRRAFDPGRASGWLGLACALLTYAGVSWLVDTLLAVLTARGTRWAFLAASGVTLLGGMGLWWQWRRAQKPPAYHLQPPRALPGLIVALSPFRSFDGSLDLDRLKARLEEGGPDAALEDALGRTNWGPLFVAVRHHAPALRYCRVLCSAGEGGSEDQYPVAEALIRAVLARAAGAPHPTDAPSVEKIVIDDPHDVTAVARKVDGIFDEAERLGFGAGEVVADITGGTAAMSAGMVLASLPEGRAVEYLRQDRSIMGDGGRLRAAEEIMREGVLVAVHVGAGSLPERLGRETD